MTQQPMRARAAGGPGRRTHKYIIEGGFAALLAQARAQRGLSGKDEPGKRGTQRDGLAKGGCAQVGLLGRRTLRSPPPAS